MSDYVLDDREMPRFKVNREAMVDTAVLAQERSKIFDKCWLYVGHESELKSPTASRPEHWLAGPSSSPVTARA